MNQASPLPLPGSHFIPLSQAIEMTSLYRSQRENILATPYQNQNILPICETFNRADVDTIMAKQNCEAIRIYFGMDETFKVKVIIVPVDENAEDILPVTTELTDSETSEDIVEEGHRCPPACPPPSPLNT